MVVAIALLLNVTSPTAIGPVGILGLFVCMYTFFMCSFFLAMSLIKHVIEGIFSGRALPLVCINSNTIYYYSTVLALAPVIYIGMCSIGNVGLFEIGLLILFEVLACFFIYKKY